MHTTQSHNSLNFYYKNKNLYIHKNLRSFNDLKIIKRLLNPS